MKFAADENFDGVVLRGLLKRLPTLDIVRVQDTDMAGATDPDLLEWLAEQDRILVTHDIQTIRLRSVYPYTAIPIGVDNLLVLLALRVKVGNRAR